MINSGTPHAEAGPATLGQCGIGGSDCCNSDSNSHHPVGRAAALIKTTAGRVTVATLGQASQHWAGPMPGPVAALVGIVTRIRTLLHKVEVLTIALSDWLETIHLYPPACFEFCWLWE